MREGYLKIRTTLISVSDKRGLTTFAQGLLNHGVRILATTGTYRTLEGGGVQAERLEDHVRYPELLEGRVKTLQAEVFLAILAKRTPEHLSLIRRMGLEPLDMVVCNFYPFREVTAKPDVGVEEAVEAVDIGGPSLVRAAAKNHDYVVVVPSPHFYERVLEEMEGSDGGVSQELRRSLAQAAFAETAAYDIAIYNRLRESLPPTQLFPERYFISASRVQEARYGENPDQRAAIYELDGYTSMARWRQLAGEPLSFNNYLDIGRAYELLGGFEGKPTAATVKHGHISGFAFAPNLAEAYTLAHECDPEADYGGTVVLNRRVDVDSARLIGRNEGVADRSVYTEIVIAPGFDAEAEEILRSKQKRKMKLIEVSERSNYPYDVRLLEGALLVQEPPDYRRRLDPSRLTYPTRMKPDQATSEVMLALWEVVRRVESNGIVIGKGIFGEGRLTHLWTLGVASFRKRSGAVKIALDNAGERAKGAVAASDGFFPFRDSIDLLAEAGVKGVIQPGGSIRDRLIVEAADEYGMAMVFTHTRAFRH